MGVDGGAGNAISLSEVQTFYGGSNPISMSEYYRGGSEVPSTVTSSSTGTMSISSAITGTPDSNFWDVFSWSAAGTLDFTISFTSTRTGDPETTDALGILLAVVPAGVSVTTTVSGGAQTSFGTGTIANNGQTLDRQFNCALIVGAGEGTVTRRFQGTVSSGGAVYAAAGSISTRHSVTSNSSTTTTSTTTNTNTNVPTSGTINMNVFNAPGTASA